MSDVVDQVRPRMLRVDVNSNDIYAVDEESWGVIPRAKERHTMYGTMGATVCHIPSGGCGGKVTYYPAQTSKSNPQRSIAASIENNALALGVHHYYTLARLVGVGLTFEIHQGKTDAFPLDLYAINPLTEFLPRPWKTFVGSFETIEHIRDFTERYIQPHVSKKDTLLERFFVE